MKNYESLNSDPSSGQEAPSIESSLRIAGQLAGVALVAIGGYYAVLTLAAAIGTARSPAGWEGALEIGRASCRERV